MYKKKKKVIETFYHQIRRKKRPDYIRNPYKKKAYNAVTVDMYLVAMHKLRKTIKGGGR